LSEKSVVKTSVIGFSFASQAATLYSEHCPSLIAGSFGGGYSSPGITNKGRIARKVPGLFLQGKKPMQIPA
jgi:hypothetical protein